MSGPTSWIPAILSGPWSPLSMYNILFSFTTTMATFIYFIRTHKSYIKIEKSKTNILVRDRISPKILCKSVVKSFENIIET